MAKKFLVPVLAGVSALALVGGATAATAMQKNDVTLVVDGIEKTVALREDTVAEVLDLEGIALGDHDVVLPGVDTEVTDGLEISIAYGRPLNVTVDGQEREVWTTARSVGEALRMLNLDAADSKLSASRSQAISREGLDLSIVTAKDVTLTVAGKATNYSVPGTVQDLLTAAGVIVDADDKLEPAADTELVDGMAVKAIKVETKERLKNVELPFQKKTVESKKLEKGVKKVTTEGRAGLKVEKYTDTYEDGVAVTSVLVGSEVTKKPVDQVTTVGTYVAPKPKPVTKTTTKSTSTTSTASKSTSSSSTSSSSGSSSGAGLNLAREAMWVRIAECESNNRWNINTGNGYYGGLQFNLATWRSVNGDDFAAYPHQATRAEQITVANRLYAKRGTQPWSCA